MRFANIPLYGPMCSHPAFSTGDQTHKPKLCISLSQPQKFIWALSFTGSAGYVASGLRQDRNIMRAKRVWQKLPTSWWPGGRMQQRKGWQTRDPLKACPSRFLLPARPATSKVSTTSKNSGGTNSSPYEPVCNGGGYCMSADSTSKDSDSSSKDSTHRRSHLLKMICVCTNYIRSFSLLLFITRKQPIYTAVTLPQI